MIAVIARGLLLRLDTAFNRDHDRKTYVQHHISEDGKGFFAWLADGAHVFACGDAKRMAVDVDRALREVIHTHRALGDDAAAAYLAELVAPGRYRRYVY